MFVLRVNVTGESKNRLTKWLAEDDSQNRTRLVLFRRLFGSVKELWMLDMGLGPIRGDFHALSEDEYDDIMMEDEEEEMLGANVVEISNEDTSEDEAVIENDEKDGGEDMHMILFGAKPMWLDCWMKMKLED